MNSEHGVRLALDARPLAQDPRTTSHRIATELFPRLIKLAPLGLSASESLREADVSVMFGDDAASPKPVLEVRILLGAPAGESGLDERTLVWVVSRQARNRLLLARPDLGSAQVMVLPIAPKSDVVSPTLAEPARLRSKYGLPESGRYLVGLAHPSESSRLVRAFSECLREPGCEDLSLVLLDVPQAVPSAGQGPSGAHLIEHPSRVVRLVSLEEADAPLLFAGALAMLNAGDSEGFETAMLEAMAAGLPVVAEAHPLNADLLGDSGELIDFSDVRAVASSISRLASSAALRSEMSERARRRAGSVDWDSSAAWAWEVIQSAMNRRRRRLVNLTYPVVPSEADPANWNLGSDGRAIAGLAGFPNGAQGPAHFGSQGQTGTQAHAAWPRWVDRLPAPGLTGSRIEGGLRLSGRMKQGSAERPLVSYVTVVRNNKATLERTIQSVQQQTYDNVEHIVLDGASTDGTVDLIQGYADRIDYFVSEPDRGLYDALNKAIALARGELICVLNSDDWLEPAAAEIAARRLVGRRDALVVLSGAAVETDKQVIEWYPALLHPGCYFACANDCHNAVYATPAAYEKTGPYDTSYKIAADFKWLMACVDQGVAAIYTREITVNYSLGGTSGDVRAHSLECCRVVAERFSALSPAEVHCLYHCFFALGVDKPSLVPDRPADAQAFLKHLAERHAADAQFMNALAWAMLHAQKPVAAIPSETRQEALGVRAASRQLVRAVLRRYPGLAKVANRMRAHAGRPA